MIRVGTAPYLECSSRGDKRFSAFYAKPKCLKGKSIEEAYQGTKIINGHSGLTWREAKGKQAENPRECAAYYKEWWKEYIIENDFLHILKAASGLSDIFGQENHLCQAKILWELRNEMDI